MTTIEQAALAATSPTCSALTGVVTPGPFGFERHTCHQQRGLRSFTDGRGETRWYCVAPGHQQSVVHRFGRADGPESAERIRRLADSYRPTLREERGEMLADRELVADEFGGRTW